MWGGGDWPGEYKGSAHTFNLYWSSQTFPTSFAHLDAPRGRRVGVPPGFLADHHYYEGLFTRPPCQ